MILFKIQEKFLIWLKKRNKNIIITKKVSQYIENLMFDSTASNMKNAYREIVIAPNSSYQTPITEVRFLEFLVKAIHAKNILEVGTFKGFTSASLAIAAGSEANVVTCELDKQNIEDAHKLWKNMGVDDRINLMEGKAIDSMKKLLTQKALFDFIYIDADKSSYIEYFNLALKMVKKGSIIVIDNALWAGLVAYPQTTYSHAKLIATLNKKAFNNNGTVTLIPAWDGALMVLI